MRLGPFLWGWRVHGDIAQVRRRDESREFGILSWGEGPSHFFHLHEPSVEAGLEGPMEPLLAVVCGNLVENPCLSVVSRPGVYVVGFYHDSCVVPGSPFSLDDGGVIGGVECEFDGRFAVARVPEVKVGALGLAQDGIVGY